jgi:hypothetical protein
MSALPHFRAILLLLFLVTVVIPATILFLTGPDTFDLWHSYPTTRVGLPILGGVLICLGLVRSSSSTPSTSRWSRSQGW